MCVVLAIGDLNQSPASFDRLWPSPVSLQLAQIASIAMLIAVLLQDRAGTVRRNVARQRAAQHHPLRTARWGLSQSRCRARWARRPYVSRACSTRRKRRPRSGVGGAQPRLGARFRRFKFASCTVSPCQRWHEELSGTQPRHLLKMFCAVRTNFKFV